MIYHFIINPIAGNKISEEVIAVVKAYGEKDPEFNYEIQLTEFKGHGTYLAKTITNPDDIIINVGGDGSTYDIINGLQPGVKMGIIPAGTGNDFMRMLELPAHYTIKDIIEETIVGKTVKVDCGLVNNEHKYINSFNIGLDVDVLLEYDRMRSTRKMGAQLSYIVAAIKVLMKYKSFFINFTIDGKKGPRELILMTMMNGKFYGGGFKPTPSAEVQDGQLDVCYVERLPFRKVPNLFLKYRKGTHQTNPKIHVEKFNKIEIEGDLPIHYGCDGEVYQGTKLEVSILKDAVTLLVPQISTLK